MRILHTFGSALAIVLIGSVAFAQPTLATIHIGHTVLLNGQSVPPGTYQVRLTDEFATPVVGESPRAEQWAEFLQGGKVVARELASVLGAEELREITGRPMGTTGTTQANPVRVQELKGGDYLRVSILRSGKLYVVNAPLVR